MTTEYQKTMNEAQNKGWAKGCLSAAIIKLECLESHTQYRYEKETVKGALNLMKEAMESLSK
ncbi:MAG: hypothetical protein EBR82_78395 [Caulobacteraceae bacterium]|jgi:hypothetical protein|nr:hypothetical protein [Caulobacteraceae bacterium]